MIVDMNTVGQSPNHPPRVYQVTGGPKKGRWTWVAGDWAGDIFDTRNEAASDMQRVIVREGQASQTISALFDENTRLRALVAEMVDVYWGEGDSDPHNPPDIIKRAKNLLKS